MEKFFTIAMAALFLTGAASAQELQMDSVAKKWVYRGVVEMDSAGAGVLYDRVRRWVGETYTGTRDQVTYESRETGAVVVRGAWLTIKALPSGDLMWHMLRLEVTTGRVGYTFTDMMIEHRTGAFGGSNEYMENTAVKKHRTEYAKRCAEVVNGLGEAVGAK